MISHRLVGFGVGADYFIDRINLHRLTTSRVRHNWILEARLIDQDGLGNLREQIDDGCASQTEGPFVHSDFEALMTSVLLEGRNHEQKLGLRGEPSLLQLREPLEAHEEEFLRECKVLLRSEERRV